MKRRQALNSLGIAGISALAAQNLAAQSMMGSGNMMMGSSARFGDTIIPPSKEAGQEKHVPFIDAPTQVKPDEKFEVTVEVGRVVAHPNTIEHHIESIELYALADGSPYVVKVAAVHLGPTYGSPKVTLPVMLPSTSTLYAVSYCNIHGVWDNATRVEVR